MFSLIITIISIALVVALVAATMYYGGSALNQGTVKADASGFVAGAQQIAAALTMYETEGNGGTVALYNKSDNQHDFINLLIADNYLATVPVVKSGKWNTIFEPSTIATTWELNIDHIVVINADSSAIVQSVLKATVINPDVCVKLHADGNKDGLSNQSLYDCEIDPNSTQGVFKFFLARRLEKSIG